MQMDISTKYRIWFISRENVYHSREAFALRYNYDQKVSFIRSLAVQDICLTYKDWFNLGRLPESMSDQLNSRGQWPYLSMEGSPLRIDLFESSSILSQLKKFPIHLLDIWNQRIGQILETVIGSLPPQSSDTLSYLFQLQQVEIFLQNALHSQKGDIALKLREHMRMRIPISVYFLDLRNILR